jgi:HD-GYP domain-containing protein (c-di-GMP phosphodiesterase class II)
MQRDPFTDSGNALKSSDSDSSLLKLLLEIGRAFNSSLDFQEVVSTVMDKVIEVLKAERGCLMIVGDDLETKVVAARGLDRTAIAADRFACSRSVLRRVIQTRESILTDNLTEDARFAGVKSVILKDVRSMIATPILFQDRVRGLIYVDNSLAAGMFDDGTVHLLEAIANQAAGAIENARLYNMKKEIILVLANAIEAKDSYTRGHIERVCSYCLAIARELRLSPGDVSDLEISSFLHDVGKIGVPDAVLQKPGRLTDEERLEMEKHSILGEALVLPIDVPRRVKVSIRQHQERWDGKGYPDGTSGEEIELFARIIAVADTWDAMTSDRPYRKALDRQIAIDEMKRSSGTQLDPTVVSAFLRAVERGEESAKVSVVTEIQ